MSRVGFGVGALASVLFLCWFGWLDTNNPGFSIPVGLIVLTLFLTTFAFAKVKGYGVTLDGKGAAWTAFSIAVVSVGYMFVFKNSWLTVAAVWAACQLPGVIAVVASPTADDQKPSE